tara:strand:- start:18449 stop:18949 length:501 start_codon:yes stop_codon:yes gene_type:complete
MTELLDIITKQSKLEIDKWVNKFPEDKKLSAVIPALTAVQKQNDGSLNVELMDAVASYLGVPRISVYEVATFYSMFEHKKVGKHKLCVCTNISCMLRGSEEIVDHLKNKLQINFGEVTNCGTFSLKEVECLGACVNAPVMQIEDKYYENLSNEKIDEIIEELSESK